MPNVHGDAQARKEQPVYSGFLKYFPRAVAAVAHLSKVGNDQHNPGKPLHWDRSKSGDELDAAARHLLDAGTFDTDGERHSTKLAWRALANLEKELEAAEAEALGRWPDHEAQAAVEGRSAPQMASTAPLQTKEEIVPEVDYNALGGLAGGYSTPPHVADVADWKDGWPVIGTAEVSEAPFVPMAFTRPPRTEDYGPEYETDGEAVSDAVGYQETEAVSDEAANPASPPRHESLPPTLVV